MLQLQGCNFRMWKRPMGCICRPNFSFVAAQFAKLFAFLFAFV